MGPGAIGQADRPAPEGLPEQARVYWRPRADDASLSRTGWLWTLSTASHTVPFVAAAVLLVLVAPVTTPVALVLLAHAWVVPELYAARGAGVLRLRAPAGADAEQRALLLLGDLIAHLLLALRCDERGFVTVANLAFSGSCWRLRRRLRGAQLQALAAAREAAGPSTAT